MGGSEGGEPRRAAKTKQPRLGHPAGWRGLSVTVPQFPKWLEARESPGQTAGPLSPPSGPASVLVEESAGYHHVALHGKENHESSQRPHRTCRTPSYPISLALSSRSVTLAVCFWAQFSALSLTAPTSKMLLGGCCETARTEPSAWGLHLKRPYMVNTIAAL